MRTELLLATLILGTAACGDPPAPAGGSAAASGSGAKPHMSAAKTATATATATATMTASAAPTTSAAPDAKAIVGTCTHKGETCKEYLGSLPADAETTCVGKDKKGEFAKGSTACSHENALGTCEMKVGDLEQAVHYYKKAGATDAGLKKTCEGEKGTWVPEAAAAGSASAAAGSAAPAAGSAAPKK